MSITNASDDIILPLIQNLLRRPIAFHRIFADVAGGACNGLFLSQAWYWSQHTTDPEGWFYKTQEEWEAETALSRREQETARKYLKSHGLLEEERRGLPAKLYYRLNVELLQTRMYETSRQGCTKRADRGVRNEQTFQAETTTETTTERELHPLQIMQDIQEKKKRKHPSPPPGAEKILTYLNEVTGRHYRDYGLIPERLNGGATVEECLLVIRFLHEYRRHKSAEEAQWVLDYLNTVTPFRRSNFDKYRAQAEEWQAKGQQPAHSIENVSGVLARIAALKEGKADV